MWQAVVVFIIVVGAAWMLWRSLRHRGSGDCGCGCEDCPARRDCKKPRL